MNDTDYKICNCHNDTKSKIGNIVWQQQRALMDIAKEKECIITSFSFDSDTEFTLSFESIKKISKQDLQAIVR